VDLCGHATIAAFSLLHQQGQLSPGRYTQETGAGILAIEIQKNGNVFMAQKQPEFLETPSIAELTDCLQISQDYLLENLPIQVVSTGLRDILVPIRNLGTLLAIQPDFGKVAAISRKYNTIGIHMFTLETLNGATAHCRNLAPLYGKAATGTANGALSCYLYRYGILQHKHESQLRFEQDYSMQRSSEIQARLLIENMQIQNVYAGGSAELIG
jgi:PhzF family phenazine biosynthesis protein